MLIGQTRKLTSAASNTMKMLEPLLSCFFLCFSLSLGTIYTKKDSQSDAVHGVIKNYLDKQLRVFTGIPYAQPPKGK